MSHNKTYRKLPGTDNIKARKLYSLLKAHHKYPSCPTCDSYPQYGATIVRGNFFQHIRDIANFPIDPSDFFKLKEAGLIELEQITPNQHRIVFVELAPQEIIG